MIQIAVPLPFLGDGLFESGSTSIQDQYYPVLAAVGQALNSVDGQVVVTGYTDNTPIQSLEYPSKLAFVSRASRCSQRNLVKLYEEWS